jgi:type I restriction enzyme S subunit
MSDAWVETTLGEIAFVNPKDPSLSENAPFITMADVDEWGVWAAQSGPKGTRGGIRAKGSDVLVARITPCLENGKIAMVPRDFGAVGGSTEFIVIRADEGVLPEFLFRWATSQATHSAAISLMTGTTGRQRVSGKDFAELPITVPPVAVQRRIVDLMAHLDNHLANLRAERDAATRLAATTMAAQLEGVLGDSSRQVRLSAVWTEASQPEKVLSHGTYSIAGVLNQGKGLIDKGEILGNATQYSRLFRLRVGQVVMRRLTAWEGPIAVVPDSFDGWYVSNEFPTFEVDESLMTVGFADALCQWPGLWDQMRQRVTGSVMRRKRLSAEQLLSVEVPLPAIDRQRMVSDAVAAVRATAKAIDDEITALEGMRASAVESLLGGEVAIPMAYDSLLDVVA